MATTVDPATTGPTLAGYQLRLPDYEGPLDVLLRLVERSQMAITDISLVAVLDQFLSYVRSIQGAPASVIAEFASVGTRLTLLKSRSLLPRPPVIDEEEDLSDLTSQLIEYKRLRDVAMRLGEIHASGTESFAMSATKANSFNKDTTVLKLAAYEPSALWRSIRRRIAHLPRPEQIIQQRPLLSLREVISRATSLLIGSRSTTFSTLVRPYVERNEIATAFLAVLVLMRRRVIDAEQSELFGRIDLHRTNDMLVETENDAISEFEPA